MSAMKNALVLAFLAVSSGIKQIKQSELLNSVLPDAKEFLPRLQQSLHASNVTGDPCKAQVILKHFYHDGGFGARVNTLVDSIILAVSHDPPQSVAFCGVKTDHPDDFYQNMWAHNFENGLGFPVCGKCSTALGDAVGQLWPDLLNVAGMHKTQPEKVDGWRHAVLTKFFTLQLHTKGYVAQTLGQAALGNEPYIGVHIRHGDKGREAKLIGAQKYADRIRPVTSNFADVQESNTQKLLMIAQQVKQAVKLHKINVVYLASDDAATLEQLQKSLPGVSVKRAARVDEKLYGLRTADSEHANLALFTDLVALWRSNVFIGTGSSNIGRLVWALRGEEQRQHDISLDNPFGVIPGV